MLFYSPVFLFFVLPIILIANRYFKGQLRIYFFVLFSLLFYIWGEPRFAGIAVLSAIFDYFCAQKIFDNRQRKQIAKVHLFCGVAVNLSLLTYFKYADFLVGTTNSILGIFTVPIHFALPAVLLPVGISFIVFEKITYLVDVYRGKGMPAASFISYLLYVFLFPKLLAGPIIKYHDLAGQLDTFRYSPVDFFAGFRRFSIGLIKKLFLAELFAEIADKVFALPVSQLGGANAWLGAFSFSMQIYFDFSAYSDMAIGLGRMLGFRIMENFNFPYVATSFTEFWRRWHISLSTWIKEYLYIPLGGNQGSAARIYLNLWVCFLASGLWHGASWMFVGWGAYNGFFLVLDRLAWLKATTRLPRAFSVSVTFVFVLFGWVLFRSKDSAQLGVFLTNMLYAGNAIPLIYLTPNLVFVLFFGIAWFIMSVAFPVAWFEKLERYAYSNSAVMNLATALLTILGYAKAVSVSFNPFIYFRF